MRTTRFMGSREKIVHWMVGGGQRAVLLLFVRNGKPWISVLLTFLWSLLRGPTTNRHHGPISNSTLTKTITTVNPIKIVPTKHSNESISAEHHTQPPTLHVATRPIKGPAIKELSNYNIVGDGGDGRITIPIPSKSPALSIVIIPSCLI